MPKDGSALAQSDLAYWIHLLRIAQPAATLVALFCAAVLSNYSAAANGPRRRRTRFVAAALLALLSTYFAAGVLLVIRAVVSSKVWTPALPLWKDVDSQILFELIALGSTLTLIAWQQKRNGIGRYAITPLFTASVLGGITDVVVLSLYALAARNHSKDIRSPWTWAQLALQAVRILILWPLLLVLANSSRQGASDEEQEEDTTADAQFAANSASAAQSHQPSEQTALLAATNNAGPSSYNSTGDNTPTKKAQQQAANSSAASANASMGLSLSSAPPPPTFRVFFQRIVLLFPYLWPSKSTPLQALAILCVFLLIAGRLVNLAVPLILGRIVDRLASTGTQDNTQQYSVWWLIGGYALLKCLQGSGGLLVVLQNFAWLPLQQYSDRQMSLMAFRHLLDLSMSFHTKRKTGEVLRILDRGSSINNFFQYLIFSVAPIFFDIFIATGFLSLTFGPQVGLLLFAIMFVYTAISIKMTTWRTGLRRDANNKDSVSRAIHTDVLLNWETVKSYNNEGYESERYRLSLLDYQRAEWKVNASLNVLNLVQNLTLSIGTLLMLFVVAYDVVNGYASSSDFVVFISYLSQIYTPLNMLSTLYRVIQTSLVDTDKLIALLGEEKDIKDVPGATDLEVREGVIEFRDVKFSYDGKVEALKGLNFTIKPKSKVALVGESGAGKSSVLRLLYRFYDPSSGQILIDGQDIRKVTQHSLRKAIGVVPQEAGLLNTSIRTNIGYGRTEPPASDEEIDAAASAAQILDKINTFPEGMSTVVGERGVRLSGGEKQRVAIARTFLKAPPVLLLDEATSALDSQTERQLQSALQTLMQDKTSLTIAHRLSTIVNSDQIIVLHDGAVVESGTHEELLELPQGRYRAMWKSQVETDKQREREAARGKEEERAVADEGQQPSNGPQEPASTSAPLSTKGAAPAATDEAATAATAGQDVAPEVLAPVQEASKEVTPDSSSVVDHEDIGDEPTSSTPAEAVVSGEAQQQGLNQDTPAPGTPTVTSPTEPNGQSSTSIPQRPGSSSGATPGISLSRHSTQSVTTTGGDTTLDGRSSIGGGSTAGGSGSGRMRQRFASLMRRSASSSNQHADVEAAEQPASPTTRSPTLLKRSLSMRSNQSGGAADTTKSGTGTGTSSPRLGSAKQLFGMSSPSARDGAEDAQAQPSQAQSQQKISTSGVSAGGKKKKGGKRGGKRK